jgi:hypothetical protein
MPNDNDWNEAPTPPPARVQPEADQPDPSDKRAIEAWGEAKGMWPQFKLGSTRGNPETWKYAAAKTWCKWEDGQLVTEAEFDKGVADATSQVQR